METVIDTCKPSIYYDIVIKNSCYLVGNGAVEINTIPKGQTFYVLWPDSSRARSRYDLDTGTYEVRLTDTLGCDTVVHLSIFYWYRRNFEHYIKDETCPGRHDGEFHIEGEARGYILNGRKYKEGEVARGLSTGSYPITVIGSPPYCTLEDTFIIGNGQDLLWTLPDDVQQIGDDVEIPFRLQKGYFEECYWTPTDDLSCSTCPSPIASPDNDREYRLTLITPAGCTYFDTILVRAGLKAYAPNAFSPNGDGINDEYKPLFSNPEHEYRLRIFDRWGELVFDCHGSDCAWNGRKDSKNLPSGVYIMLLNYDRYGEHRQHSLGITLVR